MNPEQGKFLCKIFCDTIQMEFETTKKVIRAVPDDKKNFKPDPKSMSAHELAWHIAGSEIFFLDGILSGKYEMSGEQPAPPPTIGAISSGMRVFTKIGWRSYRAFLQTSSCSRSRFLA